MQTHKIIRQACTWQDAAPVSLFKLLFEDNMISVALQWPDFKLKKSSQINRESSWKLLPGEVRSFWLFTVHVSIMKISQHLQLTVVVETYSMPWWQENALDLFCDVRDESEDDPLWAISEISLNFIGNCQKNYTMSPYACIDEKFIAFRRTCRFTVYMPNKPDTFAIKLEYLVDATNGYLYNAYIIYILWKILTELV